MLHWNKSFWLATASYVTSFNQSYFIILATLLQNLFMTSALGHTDHHV